MSVKLLTEHHLESAQARLSLYLSKCHIVGKTGPRSAVGILLVTDASLTADPGVASSIPARSHTLVEIDYEIISTFR